MVTIIPNYQIDKNKIIDPLSLGGKNYVDPKSPLAKPITPIKQIPTIPAPNLAGTSHKPLEGMDTNLAKYGAGTLAPAQLNSQDNALFDQQEIDFNSRVQDRTAPYQAAQSQEPVDYINNLLTVSDKEKTRGFPLDNAGEEMAKGVAGQTLGPLLLSIVRKIAPEKALNLEKFASLEFGPANLKFSTQLKDALGSAFIQDPNAPRFEPNKNSIIKIGDYTITPRTLGNILVGYNAENLGISKTMLDPLAMVSDSNDPNTDTNTTKRETADRILYQTGRDIYNLRKEGKLTNELLSKMLVDAEMKWGDEIKKLEKHISPTAAAPNLVVDTIKTAIGQ